MARSVKLDGIGAAAWCNWCEDWSVCAQEKDMFRSAGVTPESTIQAPVAEAMVQRALSEHELACKPNLRAPEEVAAWLQS